MGLATLNRLTPGQARDELSAIMAALGDLEAARSRSAASLLSADEEGKLRRAEELIWLLED